ncbi:MAG: DUF3795 domain-containing protein [candidate division WOR-3 bacterium]|nr:MAG: DUF3795 domain-containing protein [candidate division WOR-3 bacterium]
MLVLIWTNQAKSHPLSTRVEIVQNMTAFCGVICTKCPVYTATQQDDDKKREEVARMWSSSEEQINPEDIICYGCFGGKKLYKFCATCEVRICGSTKKVKTCAHCGEYPCEILNEHWKKEDVIGMKRVGRKWGSNAKANLEEIRRNIQNAAS